MKRMIKRHLICFAVIVFVVLLCVLTLGKTNGGINSIENYEDIFASVNVIQFFADGNNFYGTKSPSKELKEIKKVRINSEPIAEENCEFKYRIAINDEYIIYISDDFSKLRLDDKSSINVSLNDGTWDKTIDEGEEASQTYNIKNPEVLRDLFEQHIK